MAVGGEYMPLIAQMQERPHVAVALKDDMTAATAVAAVGSTLRHIFGSVIMPAAGTTFTRATKYLDVIYEI